ncbi:glycosyltransferase family 4 protein [Vibrio alginolyticus]|uniref:glycosyltransferase family 4 protein n=1 Tax=Vibrio TaxID=662 RepID=UPI00080362C6|nr:MULTISPECIES: glycosyltransferase family 4 protein [Vibrio]ANP66410.1 hypothetical protein BAU10_00005 [Vibrio alginolyticus]MBS9901881.1 glycosyltransferase family 4 protein [Vibrio alginolyticus]MCQ9037435.1 glycosyltransferase family 4 protein [Vibrio alginolyticus]MDK9744105.1 glycosyltransferase family 4 protein [Vibrio sp. B516a]MDW2022516.1 glycosyltransferase family 4 protein [Vibrio sp. 397]
MKTILLSSLSYEGCYGGVENSLRYLSKSYKRNGDNVIILASAYFDKKFERFGGEDGVTLVRFRRKFFVNKYLNMMLFPLFILDLVWALALIKYKYPIDKSVCRNQFVCFFVNLLFAEKNVYLAPGFSHRQSAKENMTNGGFTLTLRRKLHMLFDYAALRFSKSVCVFSHNMLQQAQEVSSSFSSGSIAKKISLTKPGVDKSVFFPIYGEEKDSLKAFLGLPHDKVILLCVGRCVKAKGFELALQAMESNEHCHLVIVGDGPELDNLKELASSLCVEQSVTFFGARSDVKNFYQSSDYFFMSSTYEPLGQTILEAISCSLPVLAFESGVLTATKELMQDRGVIFIKSTDRDTMKASVASLPAVESNDYKLLSESAFELSALFDWDKLAQDLVADIE